MKTRCKILASALIPLMLAAAATAAPLSAQAAQTAVPGDADGNGKLDIRDVTALQRHIADIELLAAEQLGCADVNGDGKADIEDVTLIQRYLAEFDVAFADPANSGEPEAPRYYSDLASAIDDANHMTTANADLTTSTNAAAALCINNGAAAIELLKDSLHTPALMIGADTTMDMGDNKLAFADGAGFTYRADFTLMHGQLAGSVSRGLIEQEDDHLSLTLTVDDVGIDATLNDAGAASRTNMILAKKGTLEMHDCRVASHVINDDDSVENAQIKTLADVETTVTGCTFHMTASGSVCSMTGIDAGGPLCYEGNTMTSELDYEKSFRGIYIADADADHVIKDSSFSLQNTTAGTAATMMYGVLIRGGSRLISENNQYTLRLDLDVQRTDADYACAVLGMYAISLAELRSTSDTFVITSNTLENNVLLNAALRASDCTSAAFDHIYCAVPSMASYRSNSDGKGCGIRLDNTTAVFTETHGPNYVHGAHSGINAAGASNIDIYGGHFESPAHGGIYFSGTTGTVLNVFGGEFINTRGDLGEDAPEPYSQSPEVGVQGAFYIGSKGGVVNIAHATIYGGKQGLRIKRYIGENIDTHVDVNVNSSTIFGEWYAIADNLCAGEGVLTIGSDVTLTYGDGTPVGTDRPPVSAREISTYHHDFPHNAPDIVDNRTP